MAEVKRPLRYPLKSMGSMGGDNKQDMLYIKIFTPKRTEDIYSLDNMFETKMTKMVYDNPGGDNDNQPVMKDGKQLEQETITGFKPIKTRDDIFNEVGAQTAEIESNARTGKATTPASDVIASSIPFDHVQGHWTSEFPLREQKDCDSCIHFAAKQRRLAGQPTPSNHTRSGRPTLDRAGTKCRPAVRLK